MSAREIFNQFNVFVVETIESKTTVMKRNGMLVQIVEWKDQNKKKELHYPTPKETVSFIEENKILLQVG